MQKPWRIIKAESEFNETKTFSLKIRNPFLWDENHLSTYFLSRLHLPNLHCHVIKQWFETRCEPNYCYSWFLSCHIKYHLILIFLWIDSVTIIRVGIDVEADFSWNVSSSSVPNQSILWKPYHLNYCVWKLWRFLQNFLVCLKNEHLKNGDMTQKMTHRYDLIHSNSSLKQFRMSFYLWLEQVLSLCPHRKQTPLDNHVWGDSMNERNCKNWKKKYKSYFDIKAHRSSWSYWNYFLNWFKCNNQ